MPTVTDVEWLTSSNHSIGMITSEILPVSLQGQKAGDKDSNKLEGQKTESEEKPETSTGPGSQIQKPYVTSMAWQVLRE